MALVTTLLLSAAAAAQEEAAPACGSVIERSTTLAADVGPCQGPGLVIGADGVELDLGGHRLAGTGSGFGILVRGRRGAMVKNGTVTGFDAGVLVEGGSGNAVTDVLVRDNNGEGSLGHGILLRSTDDTRLTSNAVVDNGPFGGIAITGSSSDGPATGNVVRDTLVDSSDGPGVLLGPGALRNLLHHSVISGNQDDGVMVHAGADRNRLSRNRVDGNGRAGAGSGILVGSGHNFVQGNRVSGNAGDGIALGTALPGGSLFATDNAVLGNVATRNGGLDLRDRALDCDNNHWRGNHFDTAAPPCAAR